MADQHAAAQRAGQAGDVIALGQQAEGRGVGIGALVARRDRMTAAAIALRQTLATGQVTLVRGRAPARGCGKRQGNQGQAENPEHLSQIKAPGRQRWDAAPKLFKEPHMSTAETVYLAMVLVAFVALMATLAFGSVVSATATQTAKRPN